VHALLVWPTDPLSILLLVGVAVWAAQATVMLAGNWSYARRSTRISRLHGALRERRLDPTASTGMSADITPRDFQDLVLAGLPRDVEEQVAETLLRRTGLAHARFAATDAGASGWSRIAALQLLASARDSGVHALLDAALGDEDAAVAGAAVRMLVRLDDREAAEALVGALIAGRFSRSRVASGFERLTVPRSDMVRRLVDSSDAVLRAWGGRLAARLHDRTLAADVRRLVSDDDAVVRRVGIEALGRLGSAEDAAILRVRLRDAAPMVRAHAARALAVLRDERSTEALAGALGDRSWIVRAAARDALASFGESARVAITRALWQDDRFAIDGAGELLHRTGVAERAGREMLRGSAVGRLHLPTLRRLYSVASPQLRDALLSRFSIGEREQLQRLTAPVALAPNREAS